MSHERSLAELIWKYYVLTITENGGYRLRPSVAKYRPVQSIQAKQTFFQGFCADYSYFAREFMQKKGTRLDRHKVAAIAMINLLGIDMFENPPAIDDRLLPGFPQQEIAIDVGLTFMLDQMNYELKKRLSVRDEIPIYCMPHPFSTGIPYAELLARELYWTQKYYMLNPLSLANQLFMLEYFTLLNANINPEGLKTY